MHAAYDLRIGMRLSIVEHVSAMLSIEVPRDKRSGEESEVEEEGEGQAGLHGQIVEDRPGRSAVITGKSLIHCARHKQRKLHSSTAR